MNKARPKSWPWTYIAHGRVDPKSNHATLWGRVTAADTGKPLAGVRFRIVPQQAHVVEAETGADGRYSLAIPVGVDCRLFGLSGPPGYYQRPPNAPWPSYDFSRQSFYASAATHFPPREEVPLQPGATWRVEVAGIDASGLKEVLFWAQEDRLLARQSEDPRVVR
jgi:hypothetical protein